MPLLFVGMYIGRYAETQCMALHATLNWDATMTNYCRSGDKLQDFRPDGIMQPPVNPWLREDMKAAQQESWLKRWRPAQRSESQGK